jgi:staphylococcal nuclease domain-containing protein 1
VLLQSVVSGDTLVLVGKATSGPPPEITITLTHVQCPKIARGPSQTDEAYAWHSREYLRSLCVGKAVTFRVTQTVSSISRTFGDVLLDGVPVVKVG